MADGYDNTNKGVMFRPYREQKFAGAGKLNIDGVDHKIVVVSEPLKQDGDPVLCVYARIGVLFPNDKNGNDKAPDHSGPLDSRPGLKVAAWKHEKDGRPYLSLKVDQKQAKGGGGQADYDSNRDAGPDYGLPDDEIPF